MTLTNEEKADAQIKLFEKLTSYSLKKKGSVYVKPDLEKIDKKYFKKIAKFDELPPNSLYFISPPESVFAFWAQYYPSGFKNSPDDVSLYVEGKLQVPNHRWGEMGLKKINHDNLNEDEDGMIDGWDKGNEFYLFTPIVLENKPFLNWEQNNPWEVKE
jgi:hypothetical protein